jgi:hypothetical protein
MKTNIFLSTLAALVITFSSAAQPVADFDKTTLNYGTIEKGSDGTRLFTVTNKGNEPLIIKNATGSCSCTVPEWPKEPIMPGKSAEIKVRYNTDKVGPMNKQVTIEWNGGDPIVLRIKGDVVNEPVIKVVND